MSIEELKKIVDETKHIPDWARSKLTKEILQRFLCEFKKVFKKFDVCDWKEAFDYLTGTRGWSTALETTLKNSGLINIWDFYEALEWYESDLFDGELVDLMVEYGVL